MSDKSNQKILILGDSTIDNRVWLGKEKYHLYASGFFSFAPILSAMINFLDLFNPFKPKSVVENLIAQMPNAKIIDRTNDGFTTQSVLKGDYKDKVFGAGTHRFFPHKMFKPMETQELEKADQIILSIGGNNIREFMLAALNIRNKENRKNYIQKEYPKVFKKMQLDYQKILKEITRRNPNAKIILMTQYYPALNQKMLINKNIYDFMSELGEALGKGRAQNAMVEVMKDAYNGILKFISTDPSMRRKQISMVDVTSSLNPHFNENYEGQIEPSDIGGRCIAQMLSHVVKDDKAGKKIYRFSPDYFMAYGKKAEHVLTCNITPTTTFTPVHPDAMLKNVQYGWKRNAMILAGGILAAGAASLLSASVPLAGFAAMTGGVIGYQAAKLWHIGYQVSLNWPWRVGYQKNPNAAYQFEASAAYKAPRPSKVNKAMETYGAQAANSWLPYLKSCLPLSGAYNNEDFNRGYTQAKENKRRNAP